MAESGGCGQWKTGARGGGSGAAEGLGHPSSENFLPFGRKKSHISFWGVLKWGVLVWDHDGPG